jgi:hypothetical protein
MSSVASRVSFGVGVVHHIPLRLCAFTRSCCVLKGVIPIRKCLFMSNESEDGHILQSLFIPTQCDSRFSDRSYRAVASEVLQTIRFGVVLSWLCSEISRFSRLGPQSSRLKSGSDEPRFPGNQRDRSLKRKSPRELSKPRGRMAVIVEGGMGTFCFDAKDDLIGGSELIIRGSYHAWELPASSSTTFHQPSGMRQSSTVPSPRMAPDSIDR